MPEAVKSWAWIFEPDTKCMRKALKKLSWLQTAHTDFCPRDDNADNVTDGEKEWSVTSR